MQKNSLHALLMDYLRLQRRLTRALRGSGLQAYTALRQDPAKLRKRLQRLLRRLEAALGRARTAALAASLALALSSSRAQAFSFTEAFFGVNNPVANVAFPYTGSTPKKAILIADLNGDAVPDLFFSNTTGGFSNPAPQYFKGTSAGGQVSFAEQTGGANPLASLTPYYGTNFALADVDGNGTLDAVFGVQQYSGSVVTYFKNTGTVGSPSFSQVTGAANPVSHVASAYTEGRVFMADFKGTGKADLFVVHSTGGALTQSIDDYVNTAGSFNQVTGASNPFNGMTWTGSGFRYNNWVPVAVNLDHDGLLDVVIPTNSGTLTYYKNTGTAGAPVFTQQTGASNPFSQVTSSNWANIAFADMDGNGTLDALYTANGALHYLKNNGSITAPVFAEEGINGASSSVHTAFANLDGNGVKAYTPQGFAHTLEAWKNVGSSASPRWERATDAQNPLSGLTIAGTGIPTISFVDLHNNGILGIASLNNEALDYYDNVGTSTAPSFVQRTGASNPLSQIAHVYSPPVYADLDNDGKTDLLITSNSAGYELNKYGVRYLKNFGSLASPSFAEVTTTAISAIPGFAGGALIKAPDGSGLSDLVMTTATAGVTRLIYYKNTGTLSAPVFGALTGAADPFSAISFLGHGEQVAATDLNGDGNADLVLAEDQSTLPRWLLAPAANTPTITPSSTRTPTSTPTPSWTPSPSFTVTGSPSASASPTESQTPTPSPSATPTLTVTQTANGTFTATPTPSITLTPTAGFARSNAGQALLGPVPARVGSVIRLYFDAAPSSSNLDIYNVTGEKTATLHFGSDPNPGWDTQHVVAGIYLAWIQVTYADGSKKSHLQKVILVP